MINKLTHRNGCNFNQKAETEEGRAGDAEGGGEKEDLTLTSAFLLSKVLAAAGTDKEKKKI